MEKPDHNLHVRVTRQMFAELALHLCDDWLSKVEGGTKFAEEAKGLSLMEQESSKIKLADQLYQSYDYVIIDNEDNFFGIKGDQKELIQSCKGSWGQILEYNLL